MTLTREGARSFYDRFGRFLDSQAFYEDPAVHALVGHAQFEQAGHVVELGCGTGRHAERLLDEKLPANARYVAIDQAPKLVEITRGWLARFGARARVLQSDGGMHLPVSDGEVDRVLSTYVLDLLSDDDIDAFLDDAKRALAPSGMLCVVGLTCGERGAARAVSSAWSFIAKHAPTVVGGCRPLQLRERVEKRGWRVVHGEIIVSYAVASEVLVATST